MNEFGNIQIESNVLILLVYVYSSKKIITATKLVHKFLAGTFILLFDNIF